MKGISSPESEHLLVGRHEGQAPEIDGQVYINDGLAYPGEFVTVEVTEAHEYDLVGKVVAREDPKLRKHKVRLQRPDFVREEKVQLPAPAWLAPR